MKTKDESLKDFYWQDSYGAFSVNPSEADKVTAYIINQHDHDKKTSFQDEYGGVLKQVQNNLRRTIYVRLMSWRLKIFLSAVEYYALSGLIIHNQLSMGLTHLYDISALSGL